MLKSIDQMKAKQKYPIGTRVWVRSPLPKSMRHFRQGEWATVKYVYAYVYGDSPNSQPDPDYFWKEYCLEFDDGREHSWYHEPCLSLEEEPIGPPHPLTEEEKAFNEMLRRAAVDAIDRMLLDSGILPCTDDNS